MSKVFVKESVDEYKEKKLFGMIETLSHSYLAKITIKQEVTKLKFYTRGVQEFVCTWKFDTWYYENAFKELFNKHNSTVVDERSNKQ